MNANRLAGLEAWAKTCVRHEEVRADLLELIAAYRNLCCDYLALEGQTWERPATVPPSREGVA